MPDVLGFIRENFDWLFSGLGVTVLVFILVATTTFFKWIWKALRSTRGILPGTGRFIREESSQSERLKHIALERAKLSMNILFIEDDRKFKVVDILKRSGWQNTSIRKDVKSMDDDLVKETDVFFVDIQGVGKDMRFQEEGLGLAIALDSATVLL